MTLREHHAYAVYPLVAAVIGCLLPLSWMLMMGFPITYGFQPYAGFAITYAIIGLAGGMGGFMRFIFGALVGYIIVGSLVTNPKFSAAENAQFMHAILYWGGVALVILFWPLVAKRLGRTIYGTKAAA